MAHILPDDGYRIGTPPPLCPHGAVYAQPCYSCGWTCPSCKRNYAPWVRECNCRHEEDRPPQFPLNLGPIAPVPVDGDSDGPVLRLPREMASQHYYRTACIDERAEWAEVLPGLQARCGFVARAPAAGAAATAGGRGVFLDFRLTPGPVTHEPPAP